MANEKISELTDAGILTGTEIIPVVKAGANRRTTAQQIASLTDISGKVDKVAGKGLSSNDYTNTEKSKLASITEIFTTALKTAYDNVVSWVGTNGNNLLSHLSRTDNPHGVTKAQVGLGNVPDTDATVAANITQDTTHRFTTDAEKSTWNGKADDSAVVHVTGDETIGGKKTLTDALRINTGSLIPGGYSAEFTVSGSGQNSIRVISYPNSGNYIRIGNGQSSIGGIISAYSYNTGYALPFEIDCKDLILKTTGGVGIGFPANTAVGEKLDVNGNVKALQYKLSDLNTAPASASATGVKGEIRITADYIYVCIATNTWVRTALTTW